MIGEWFLVAVTFRVFDPPPSLGMYWITSPLPAVKGTFQCIKTLRIAKQLMVEEKNNYILVSDIIEIFHEYPRNPRVR